MCKNGELSTRYLEQRLNAFRRENAAGDLAEYVKMETIVPDQAGVQRIIRRAQRKNGVAARATVLHWKFVAEFLDETGLSVYAPLDLREDISIPPKARSCLDRFLRFTAPNGNGKP